jgi:hypothetical protein
MARECSVKNSHHLIDSPHSRTMQELACLVEHTNKDMLRVNVEPDVIHGDLRETGYRENPNQRFHVTA